MAKKKAPEPTWAGGRGWTIQPRPSAGGRRAGDANPKLLDRVLATGTLELESRAKAQPTGRRGLESPPPLECMVQITSNDAHVLVVRHPSGALTFHAPQAA